MKEEEREQKEEGTRSAFHQILKRYTTFFTPCGVSIFPLKCGLNKVAKKHMLSCQTFRFIWEWAESSLKVFTVSA